MASSTKFALGDALTHVKAKASEFKDSVHI